jgi:hypothetical protein
VESELASSWSPNNRYCFVVDSKAGGGLKARFQALARCFPDQVFIAPEEVSMDSSGHGTNLAHLSCLRLLADPARALNWRYVFTLQVWSLRTFHLWCLI